MTPDNTGLTVLDYRVRLALVGIWVLEGGMEKGREKAILNTFQLCPCHLLVAALTVWNVDVQLSSSVAF